MRVEFNEAAIDDCRVIVVPFQLVEKLVLDEVQYMQTIEINRIKGRHEARIVLDDGRQLRIEFAYRGRDALRVQAVELDVDEFGKPG